MDSSNKRRIITLFLFLGIFIFPWWFLGVLIGFSLIKIENFYEGILIAFLYDIFYFIQRDLFWNLPVFFIFSGLFFILSKLIRKQLRI